VDFVEAEKCTDPEGEGAGIETGVLELNVVLSQSPLEPQPRQSVQWLLM
jgi:hypothetical protein